MAVLYLCSMDKYGAGVGTNSNSFAGYWDISNLNLIGDGWSGNPSLHSVNGTKPHGYYEIAEPSWGARSGSYALIANGVRLYDDSAGQDYTINGQESMELAIPGASQSTRLIQFALSLSAMPQMDIGHGQIMHFMNSSGKIRATLSVDPSGRLQIVDGSALTNPGNSGSQVTAFPTVLVKEASPSISAQTWAFISIEITADGNVDVYVNDTSSAAHVITATGLAFSDSGNIDILGVLPASVGSSGDPIDTILRCIRDIALCDTTGSYANSVLGQAFVSTQEVRIPDAGGGWTAYPRENFTDGILNSHDTNTGLYFADSADFEIGVSDFTAETMWRPASLPAATVGYTAEIISKWRTDTDNRSYHLFYDGLSKKLRWEISTDGTATTVVKEIPWVPELNKWYHIAVSRTSSVTKMFIDGIEQGVGVADANTYFDGDAALAVGVQINGTNTQVANTYFDGFLDETRLTIGVGRYTASFSAPTTAFGRTTGDDADFNSVQLLMGYESETIVDESSTAHTVNVASSDPLTAITPNDNTNVYDVLINHPPLDDTYIEAPNTYATGTFTFTGLPTASETITIGSTTYTWVSALASANDVLIGASTADCISNIIAAINAGAGEGTVYGTGTTANADASASELEDPQFIITSLTIGTAGNSVATTETMADGFFNNTTLTGGTDIPADTDFSIERLPIDVSGVVAVQVSSKVLKTDAGTATVRFDLIGPSGGVGAGSSITPDLNAGWVRQIFDTDPDTSVNLTPSTIIGGKIRVKRPT